MMTNAKSKELPPEVLKNLQTLKAVRKALGLSQDKLAEKVGISTYVISNCESGKNAPSPETYSKLAEYFGWDKDDPPPPRKPPAPLKPSPVKPKPVKPKPEPPKSQPDTLPAKPKSKSVKVSFTPDSNPCRPRINVSFVDGNCYEIRDSENVREPFSLAVKQGRNSGGYIFRYEGMSAIHHVFREIHGKWIQTYTDAQLIGKYVKEVEE